MKHMELYTKKGIVNLTTLNIGDYVLSYNETTKDYEYNKVVEIIEKETDELYEITIDNEVIKVSNTHPFYNGKEYVKVSNLKIKDKVLGLDNKYYEIRKINKKEEKIKEINITVENNHNYFVGKGYLVHNYGSHSSGSSRSYGGGGGGGGRDDAAAAAEAARRRRIAETKVYKVNYRSSEQIERVVYKYTPGGIKITVYDLYGVLKEITNNGSIRVQRTDTKAFYWKVLKSWIILTADFAS